MTSVERINASITPLYYMFGFVLVSLTLLSAIAAGSEIIGKQVQEAVILLAAMSLSLLLLEYFFLDHMATVHRTAEESGTDALSTLQFWSEIVTGLQLSFVGAAAVLLTWSRKVIVPNY
jgi:hypothetical protein